MIREASEPLDMEAVAPVSLPPALRGFLVGCLFCTLTAVLAITACNHVFHLSMYPYGYYMLPWSDKFLDIIVFNVRFQHIHSTDFFHPAYGLTWSYPAASALIYQLLYLFPHPVWIFLLSSAALVVTVTGAFCRSLVSHGLRWKSALAFAGVSLVLSYPLQFELHRANIELYTCLIAGCGVYLILHDRPGWGAALIGAAAALKIYPIVYIGLLIARKRYRDAVIACLVAAVITLVGLWVICPDIRQSWSGVQQGVEFFRRTYVLHYLPSYLEYDHSLFGVAKHMFPYRSVDEYVAMSRVYTACILVGGLIVFFMRIRKLPVINQVLSLTVAAILFMPLSFDYTLLHLYTPWAMIVVLAIEAHRRGQTVAGLSAVSICMVLLMSPLGEIIHDGLRCGAQIKAVILLFLFCLALIMPFKLNELPQLDGLKVSC